MVERMDYYSDQEYEQALQAEQIAQEEDDARQAEMAATNEQMERFIDIVFDGPPSHVTGRFVEVENDQGASINFGEWVKREDGYWVLRIPDYGRDIKTLKLELCGYKAEYKDNTAWIDEAKKTMAEQAATIERLRGLLDEAGPPNVGWKAMEDWFDRRDAALKENAIED